MPPVKRKPAAGLLYLVILRRPPRRSYFDEVFRLKSRSWRYWCGFSLLACASFAILTGCGQTFFFAGRNLPPSGIANRVLVAIQNANLAGGGSLQIEDAYYDVRHSFNDKTPSFFVAGYSGKSPVTIQNMPAERVGIVYSSTDGNLSVVNYAKESSTPFPGYSGLSSSIFVSSNQEFVFSANQAQHVLQVMDSQGPSAQLSLPNVFRVSINPAASVALVFVQDSNKVYSVLRLQSHQPAPPNAEDCEPQNLPVYCLMPVAGNFDRPIKAVFSPDGSTAYILNCGPECGGQQASVSYLPTAGVILQSGAPVPPGAPTAVSATIPIPGGATDALVTGNTLYLAGQQRQSDGYLGGVLTVLNTATKQITGSYSISDGNHTKMILGDNNSLWIGSQMCTQGERFHQAQSGASVQFGCLTMFNTSTNSVTMVDSYKGDATGIAAITYLGKVYTTEGGQVYIYSTSDGSMRDNSNVTVVGNATDVAYMDAPSDDDNTYY